MSDPDALKEVEEALAVSDRLPFAVHCLARILDPNVDPNKGQVAATITWDQIRVLMVRCKQAEAERDRLRVELKCHQQSLTDVAKERDCLQQRWDAMTAEMVHQDEVGEDLGVYWACAVLTKMRTLETLESQP